MPKYLLKTISLSHVLKKLPLLLLFTCTVAQLFSADSKNITTQGMFWIRGVNTLQIDSHWSVYTELDVRTFTSSVKVNQVAFRLVGRYALNRHVQFGLGFVYFTNFPNDPASKSNLGVPEFRATHDLIFNQYFGKKLTLIHRNVFEYRFFHNATATELQSGYRFAFRYRYRLHADIILWSKESKLFKLVLSDEIMLQAGKGIVYNVFDQNRAYVALNFEPVKYVSLEAGYMNLFQERSTGKDFYSRHIFRFSVFTKIVLPHKRQLHP